jgi:hypothetical protein
MPQDAAELRRGVISAVAGLGLVALAIVGSGCADTELTGNPGFEPPPNALAFPSGVLVDPRVSTEPVLEGSSCTTDLDCVRSGHEELGDRGMECRKQDPMDATGECWARKPARWLFVTNANSDRRYNAGSLVAIDLDAFWKAAFGEGADIRPAGTELSLSDRPWCRRVANLPQVVECLEEPFVDADATVHFGNFPGPTVAWDPEPDDNEATLLVPVRGDPSITYIGLSGSVDGPPVFDCDQHAKSPRRRCGDDHRLRFLRNDPEASRISREPFRILVDYAHLSEEEKEQQEKDGKKIRPDVAYVSHQGDPDLTLISLDGAFSTKEGTWTGRPAIVHQANLLGIVGQAQSIQGGFGLAERPCELVINEPNASLDCERPLIYASMRWSPEVRALTEVVHPIVEQPQTGVPEPEETGTETGMDADLPPPIEGWSCYDPDNPDAGGVTCDPQAVPLASLPVSPLSLADVPLSTSRPILADIGFSRSGNELYVLQSNPGGLLRLDTSIGSDGEVVNLPTGQVEVCAQGTSFVIYDSGSGNEYGLVSCYRSGEIFIVDLTSLSVVGLTRAGIGPDTLAVDLVREVVYVANSLDATISIIDMSPRSTTRFTEIARIGLQEPYVQ